MRERLFNRYGGMRSVKTKQQYRLQAWYPTQKRFIVVGYGNRHEISRLERLYVGTKTIVEEA